MLPTAKNTILMTALLTLCSTTFAWQDNQGETSPPLEPTTTVYSTSFSQFPNSHQEPCLGCYRADCGRQITSYQAVDLWRGYCNEDCSFKQGRHACAGGCLAGLNHACCPVYPARSCLGFHGRRSYRVLGCDR